MNNPNPFPPYDAPPPRAFQREAVVDYLLNLSTHGYDIQSDGDTYVLPIDHGEVRIAPLDGLWRVATPLCVCSVLTETRRTPGN